MNTAKLTLCLVSILGVVALTGCGDKYDKVELAECHAFFVISGDLRKRENDNNKAIFYYELKNAIVKIAEDKNLFDANLYRYSFDKVNEYGRRDRVADITELRKTCERVMKNEEIKKDHLRRLEFHIKNGSYQP